MGDKRTQVIAVGLAGGRSATMGTRASLFRLSQVLRISQERLAWIFVPVAVWVMCHLMVLEPKEPVPNTLKLSVFAPQMMKDRVVTVESVA